MVRGSTASKSKSKSKSMGKKKSSKWVWRLPVVRIGRFVNKGRRVGSCSWKRPSSSLPLDAETLGEICNEIFVLPPSGYAGVVVGSLTFSYTGETVDCMKTAFSIPRNVDWVVDMWSDARCILVVEKYAAYLALTSRRFYDRFPSIIVRTVDQPPNAATTLFVKRMETELNLPVVALTDSDPSAFRMLSAYACRPKNIPYDIAPDIRWLGIRPTDWDKYNIPRCCRLRMTARDINTVKDLLKDDFVSKNPNWVKELNLMLKTRRKVEIEALNSLGRGYLVTDYLPSKLNDKDWV